LESLKFAKEKIQNRLAKNMSLKTRLGKSTQKI